MAVTFLAAMIAINALGTYILERFTSSYRYFSEYTAAVDDMFNPNDVSILLGRMLIEILLITAPIVFITMIVGVILNYLQVGFMLTGETLKFKLDKLNPINGLKQMFSIRSLVELAKIY